MLFFIIFLILRAASVYLKALLHLFIKLLKRSTSNFNSLIEVKFLHFHCFNVIPFAIFEEQHWKQPHGSKGKNGVRETSNYYLSTHKLLVLTDSSISKLCLQFHRACFLFFWQETKASNHIFRIYLPQKQTSAVFFKVFGSRPRFFRNNALMRFFLSFRHNVGNNDSVCGFGRQRLFWFLNFGVEASKKKKALRYPSIFRTESFTPFLFWILKADKRKHRVIQENGGRWKDEIREAHP